MNAQGAARIFGIVYLLVGGLGLIQQFTGLLYGGYPTNEDVALAVTAGQGLQLGLFPVNLLHHIVHLAVGALGLASAASFDRARGYWRGIFAFYGLLAILGFIPALKLNTTFGLIPIFGNDTWLHGLSALLAYYFGFMAPAPAEFVDASRLSSRR